jgi:hypothetical protein
VFSLALKEVDKMDEFPDFMKNRKTLLIRDFRAKALKDVSTTE